MLNLNTPYDFCIKQSEVCPFVYHAYWFPTTLSFEWTVQGRKHLKICYMSV